MKGLSLRTKVFFLFAGAALLIVVPALLLIANAVEKQAYGTATQTLAGVVGNLDSNWPQRADNLLKDARLSAADATVLRAWAAGRPHGLEQAVRKGLDDDRDVVLATDTAFSRILGPSVRPAALAEAVRQGPVVVLPDTGAPLLMAVVPVSRELVSPRGGDTVDVVRDTVSLGYLGLGTRLSAAAIRRDVARPGTAGTEVALVVGDSLIGTTFGDSVAPEVRAFMRHGAQAQKPTFGGQTFLTSRYRLPMGGVPATVVLFRRVTDELAIASGIKQSLFGIGFAALVLALVLAFVVARIVARPAQALAEASQRMARGDYAAPLPRDSGDEIGQLARAFGEMRAAIGEREQRLRSAQAEMIHREKLAATGRLVAQLSHEINNPIYNIQNCLEALERRGNPADPNREFLTLAQEELARMATLTRQLLDQSRPLSDAAQPVSVNAVVQRVLTLARGELASREIRVDAELGAGLPQVVVHPEGIQQVLANLVNNACDAMPGGGTLRLSTRADADAVEVVVEDTGTGIAEEDLPHIFEAFYTTKPGVAGIGLGLFVSEGIIRGHRGRLSVESTPGRGSRFTVRLPRETLDEAMREPAPAPGAEPVAAAVG
ncbi:MAG TPA: HAMP domain-containing sensor histidine kinase [Longimicrobium sp.]|nr:HAMP domain-containing sensor histidine kinase [Longimicrobium sp.]